MSFRVWTHAAQYITEEEDPRKARVNLEKFYAEHPETIEETLTTWRGVDGIYAADCELLRAAYRDWRERTGRDRQSEAAKNTKNLKRGRDKRIQLTKFFQTFFGKISRSRSAPICPRLAPKL